MFNQFCCCFAQCSDNSFKGDPESFHLFRGNFKITFILLKKKKDKILALPVTKQKQTNK